MIVPKAAQSANRLNPSSQYPGASTSGSRRNAKAAEIVENAKGQISRGLDRFINAATIRVANPTSAANGRTRTIEKSMHFFICSEVRFPPHIGRSRQRLRQSKSQGNKKPANSLRKRAKLWLREAATTITCDLLTAIFLSTPNPTRGEWLLKIAAFIPSYSEQQREYRLHYNSTATFSRRKIRHCAPNAVSAGSFVIYHL